jgi:uncharacterized lipoprotein YmbA
MYRSFAVLSLLLVVAFVGCASSPSMTTYYLLRADQIDGTERVDAKIRVGLGRVVVAPYLLSSKGIVLETAAGEINPASHHEWAEPLDAGLRWYLRSEIATRSGLEVGGGLTDRRSWDYSVDVLVAQLHGTMSGTALMQATFIVVPTLGSQEISQVRFSKSIPLPRDGYVGVVEAEKILVGEFAGLIADSLRERMNP